MMMTMMISVELEGVFTHRQTDRLKVHLTAVWKKKLPSSNSSSSTLGLLFLVVVVVSKITTEEISSLC